MGMRSRAEAIAALIPPACALIRSPSVSYLHFIENAAYLAAYLRDRVHPRRVTVTSHEGQA